MNFDPYEFDRSMADNRPAETLGEYVSRTFLWMVLGLMITFGVAMITWMTGLVQAVMQFHLVILVITLVLSFTMSARIEKMSAMEAKGIFVAFSAVFGLTMSAYLWMFGLSNVILTFLVTALYFGALAIYGRITNTNLAGYRPILVSGLVLLIAFGVLSLFIPGFVVLDRLVCMIGIATFLGYTAYDTQRICDYYYYYCGHSDMLEKASVFSALQLYMDFINLFLYLLRYFGRRSN